MQNQLLFVTSMSNHTIQEKMEIIEKNIREKNELIFQVIREIIQTFHVEPYTSPSTNSHMNHTFQNEIQCQKNEIQCQKNEIQRQKNEEDAINDFEYDLSPKRCAITGNVIPEPLYDEDGFPYSTRGLPEYDEYDENLEISRLCRFLSNKQSIMRHTPFHIEDAQRCKHAEDYENCNKRGLVNPVF